MALAVAERRSAHFELRSASQSLSAEAASALLQRLESARSTLISEASLDDATAGIIPVYLVEVDSRSDVITVDGQPGIVATYRADAPAVDVERTLAQLLTGSAELETSLAGSTQRAPLGMGGVLRRSAGYLRPYWLPTLAIGICLLIATAFDIILPLSFRFLIDNAILPGNYGLMAAIVAGLLGLFVAQTLATLIREFLAARVGAGVLTQLRAQIFEHLQTLSPGFYGRAQTGDLLARYSSDLKPIELVVTKVLPLGSMVLIGLVGSIVLLFTLEWRLALVTLLCLPTFGLGPVLLGKRAAKASYERQRDGGAMLTSAQEAIAGHLVVRAFGLERFFAGRFEQDLRRLSDSTVRASFLGALLGAGGGISLSLTQVVSLGLGAYFVSQGAMSLGALVAFQGLLSNVVQPLRELAQITQMLQDAAGAQTRLDEIFDERPGIRDLPGAAAVSGLRTEVAFDSVQFQYEDGTPALTDVSFSIRAGTAVGIVGPSGCGKSTVLNLLMRNYDPSGGRVTFDGRDLRQVTQASLRRQLGVVFQDTALFDLSVRENIRLGRLDASDEEVEDAARLAEVHTSILSLPSGYETIVGEGGGRLSGGQRQRIAIARALLRRPAMLVLDEPTSALDPEAEQAVNATLVRLRGGRTIVTVTHRLASVADCDQIIVLEGGRVAECGTHAELVARDGAYRRLWQQATGVDQASASVERLASVPVFRGFDAVLLSVMAERLTREEFAAGETICQVGEPGDAFYLIVRGQVDVLVPGRDHAELRVNSLRDGDYFGEMALIEDCPRTATVRARTATTLLVMDRTEFLDLLKRLPRLRSSLEAAIHERREAERQLLASAAAR